MKLIRIMPVLLSILLLGACASPFTVDSDYTAQTDFGALKTYNWYNGALRDPRSLEYLGGDIFDKRVRSNIDAQLQAKGYQLKTSGPVDFKVNYDVLTQDRQDINTFNTYGGMAPGYYGHYGYGGMGMGMGTSTTQVVNYKQGQLIIDIILPANETLVWRGTAEGRIPKKVDAQKREESTAQLVAEILANFPPDQQ
jgi:hypothetical protein